jgi:hypothetical protein
MTLIPELERELEAAIGRRIATPRAARVAPRLAPRLAVVLAAALLLLAAAALAATGVIPLGAPTHDPAGAPKPDPHRGIGTVLPRQVALLGLRVADPDGGPPWGLRITGTTRGLQCLQVGRVVNGRLGGLGQDAAFHDDGRFHPFPAQFQMLNSACAQPDADDHLFTNETIGELPASAILEDSCYPRTVTGDRSHPRCPDADERRVFLGALGPQARSVTYTGDDGRDHTQALVPRYGAYLIVLHEPAQIRLAGVAGGPAPTNTTITKVTFADGTVCRVSDAGWVGRCPLPGLTPLPRPDVTAADVRAPVHARVEHRRGRPVVVVRWRARVAVTRATSAYGVTRRLRGAHTWGSGTTQRDIRRGEVVEQVFYGAKRGLYTGVVTYVDGGPGVRPLRLVVGTYRLRVG